MNAQPTAIREAVRDGVARAAAVVGLAGFALIHLLDLPGTMSATPYIGWLYLGLIVSALGLAGALVRTSDSRVWMASTGLVMSVIAAYVLSRTTGLPQSTDDIGNWAQPGGIAMLLVGACLLAVNTSVLVARTAPTPDRAAVRRGGAAARGRLRPTA